MKIKIYYGGRGILDDPTLFVINKMQDVLKELNVTIERFNLYEMKNNIVTLPATLNDADGIILATTVEWYGIGGYMQQFLDACWLYGNKEAIAKIYMCPVVMSTTYGERDGKLNLSVAWEILGGLPCSGICGYVNDMVTFETNHDYIDLIERKAENIYRTISQKTSALPASNQVVKKMVSSTNAINLTPQETEQLSKYASDDTYVQKQKQDIQELASLFKDMLEHKDMDESTSFINDFQEKFHPQGNFTASYKFIIKEKKKPLIVEIINSELVCHYGNKENVDVVCRLTNNVMNTIIEGRMTFQRAFMSGDMQVKGDFRLLRMLDQLFSFSLDEA
ncbi:MAG: SCP2 sterol-binding domain-containing protein [Clostridia bacterium]|nr:SCP2 sterol-binding domain-containing protein [Clostridia bacterium]